MPKHWFKKLKPRNDCAIKKRIFDLHVHSHFSFDSNSSVEAIVKNALRKGMSGIAIIDHHTIQGGVEGKKYSSEEFMVIVGAEYSTELGHILGLFLEKEIPSGLSTEQVIEAIHLQGGLAILAHPFKYISSMPENILKKFDGIEVFNSRAENLFWCGQNNQRAFLLRKRLGCGFTGGSDAHFLYEIGRTTWICDCDLTEGDVRQAIVDGKGEVDGLVTSPIAECLSQFVKSLKLKRWRIMVRAFVRTSWRFIYSLALLANEWLRKTFFRKKPIISQIK